MKPALSVVRATSAAPASTSAEPHISIRNVTKTYQTKSGPVESLRPIELDLRRGEFLAIVGPSGCGKSTLLKVVAGLIPATTGEIRIDEKRVVEPPEGVGIVFQNPVLLPWRTVWQNVTLQLQMRGHDVRKYEEAIRHLIETAGLQNFENSYPWELSGGMKQRAAICRALVHDPQVLLMDEPFGALDAMTREKMNAELQRIWAESRKTVMLITHSIPEAVFLADRVVVMSSRPGSVEAIYEIELPRPRPLSVMGEPDFIRYCQMVRKHFFAQGEIDT